MSCVMHQKTDDYKVVSLAGLIFSLMFLTMRITRFKYVYKKKEVNRQNLFLTIIPDYMNLKIYKICKNKPHIIKLNSSINQ